MIQSLFHLSLHLLLPVVAARFLFRNQWKMAWLIMALTMVVDLDHLLANPVYDPNRCSIGFHPLHSYIAIFVYALMVAVPKLRIAAVGLLIHMAVDLGDCQQTLEWLS